MQHHHTSISIAGDSFRINGKPTYEGRSWNGHRIEGLLFNSRMVQGIFDDLNPETRSKWKYPDTGAWDPERNNLEFVEAMRDWKDHGLLAFTVNLQGGSPEGYSKSHPWINSAIDADGSLRKGYMTRLERIMNRADELGMAVILGVFYPGQCPRIKDESAVRKALTEVVEWIAARNYRNVLLEIINESHADNFHAVLRPDRIHELILQVQERQRKASLNLPVSTSFVGAVVPPENVVKVADYLLLHGNSVEDPNRIEQMVQLARQVKGYKTMPIVFNEDDHFNFDQPSNNLTAATSEYASWGYFDPGRSNYHDGYQCPPVNWKINTERKKAFFNKVREITTP